MPAHEQTYAYGHVLRFAQTMLSSLILVAALSLFMGLTGEPFDLSLYLDLALVLTIITYVIYYHHTFNAGVYLDEEEVRIDRMVLEDHAIKLENVRRIDIIEHKPQLATYFAGSRLSMQVVGENNRLTIEISDLQDSGSFLEAMEIVTQERGIPVNWQNQKGELLSADSDGQRINY